MAHLTSGHSIKLPVLITLMSNTLAPLNFQTVQALKNLAVALWKRGTCCWMLGGDSILLLTSFHHQTAPSYNVMDFIQFGCVCCSKVSSSTANILNAILIYLYFYEFGAAIDISLPVALFLQNCVLLFR